MKKSLFLLPLFALTSCFNVEQGTKKSDWNVLCPTGAPSLAFYDEAITPNLETTAKPSPTIPTAFASASFDAIVFDGLTGLDLIEKQGRAYRLARFINEGTFYLVSTKHTSVEGFSSRPSVNAFVSNGTASKLFRDLAAKKWGWGEYKESEDAAITYETGVETVRDNLLSLSSSDSPYDFYVIAEPVVTVVKGNLAKKGITLNVVKNLQDDFKSVHPEVKAVPAAGIFVSSAVYEEHGQDFDAYLSKIDMSIARVAKGDELFLSSIQAEELSGTSLATKYGFPNYNIVEAVQGAGKNKLAYLEEKGNAKEIAESFMSALGEARTYKASSFLN